MVRLNASRKALVDRVASPLVGHQEDRRVRLLVRLLLGLFVRPVVGLLVRPVVGLLLWLLLGLLVRPVVGPVAFFAHVIHDR